MMLAYGSRASYTPSCSRGAAACPRILRRSRMRTTYGAVDAACNTSWPGSRLLLPLATNKVKNVPRWRTVCSPLTSVNPDFRRALSKRDFFDVPQVIGLQSAGLLLIHWLVLSAPRTLVFRPLARNRHPAASVTVLSNWSMHPLRNVVKGLGRYSFEVLA